MKKLLYTATALTLLNNAGAASISGSTNFKVIVPEVLVLYHWDEAELTLTDVTTTADNDSDPREISDATTRKLSKALGATDNHTFTGDVSTTGGNAPTSLSSVSVILENAWAVRSISSANVELKVAEQSGSYTLTNTGASNTQTLTVSDVKLRYGTATPNATLSLAPGWAHKLGNIEFKLDLNNLTHAGTYTSNGKAAPANEGEDTFLLTLTGN